MNSPVAELLTHVDTLKDAAGRAAPHLGDELHQDLERVRAATATLQGQLEGLQRHPPAPDSAQRLRHDLRTPLNHILGYGEMIRDALDEAPSEALPPILELLSEAHVILNSIDRTIHAALGRPVERGATPLPSAARIHRPPPAPARAPPQGVHGRILAVDDNPENLALLCRLLEPAGHETHTATNGREALEMLRWSSYDLVLLDLIMPEVDGITVLTAMKQASALRHIPVVVVTGLNDLSSAVRCIQLGAADHLAKPYEPTLLMARVNACLEAKRLRDQQVEALRRLDQERKRANELLRVILPEPIVAELEHSSSVRPRRVEHVAVLFSDIVGFTKYCEHREPEEVLPHLQQLVERYEEAVVEHQMLKIKTIGDGFMAVAGLLTPVDNPVLQAVLCGQAMVRLAKELGVGWTVRVGIHVGPVVAGVLGKRQFQFDLWGDTVNTAARVESNGIADGIALSPAAWEALAGCHPEGRSLGTVAMKGKTPMHLTQFMGFSSSASAPSPATSPHL